MSQTQQNNKTNVSQTQQNNKTNMSSSGFTCNVCIGLPPLRSKEILNRHLQYWHIIDTGLPVCTFKGCKNRPNRNNKTRCGQHCTPESTIKLLTMVECKKIIKRPKIMKIRKNKKNDTVTELIHDLSNLGIDNVTELVHDLSNLGI